MRELNFGDFGDLKPGFDPEQAMHGDGISEPSVERAVEALNMAWAIAAMEEEQDAAADARDTRVRDLLLLGCSDLVSLAPDASKVMDATARLRPRAAQMACSLLALEYARTGVKLGRFD